MSQASPPLTRRLEAFHAALLARVTPAQREVLLGAEARMLAEDPAARAPRVGDLAPSFALPDPDGRLHGPDASAEASAGTVVMFVRGGWCPYCTLTLRAYQDALPLIRAAGGRVLAITPQPPPLCTETAGRDGVSFPLLSDAGSTVAEAYGVARELDPALHDFYRSLDHDLPRINGDWRLPLPGTFVLGPDRRVLLAHVGAVPYRRLEPAVAVAALRAAGAAVLVPRPHEAAPA